MLNRLRAHLLERIDRLSEGWQRFVGNHPRLIHTLKKTYIALTWAARHLLLDFRSGVPRRARPATLELLRPLAVLVSLPQQNPGLVPHRPVLRHRRLGDRP